MGATAFPGGTYAQAAAPYPATNYPMTDFLGAIALQPERGKADSPALSPQDRQHTLVFIVVLVVGGYLLWHFNYKR